MESFNRNRVVIVPLRDNGSPMTKAMTVASSSVRVSKAAVPVSKLRLLANNWVPWLTELLSDAHPAQHAELREKAKRVALALAVEDLDARITQSTPKWN